MWPQEGSKHSWFGGKSSTNVEGEGQTEKGISWYDNDQRTLQKAHSQPTGPHPCPAQGLRMAALCHRKATFIYEAARLLNSLFLFCLGLTPTHTATESPPLKSLISFLYLPHGHCVSIMYVLLLCLTQELPLGIKYFFKNWIDWSILIYNAIVKAL